MRENQAPQAYRLGDRLSLSSPDSEAYLVFGFSFLEDWGRWTEAPHAQIEISHGKAAGQLLIELQIARAYCGEDEVCDLIVEAGWGEPKLFSLGPGRARIALVVAAEETTQLGLLQIDLIIARPKALNVPPDGRALGVGIESLRVSRLLDESAP